LGVPVLPNQTSPIRALTTPPAATGPQLFAMEGATIPDSVVKLDTYSGVLSTASLHASIVALTGQAAYD
jgi:hypothetical protein